MSARSGVGFVAVAFVVLVTMPVALGQTMAERYPANEDSRQPTPGWAPQFLREVNTPQRERVHLNVDWADNELAESPVTFGVPFPDGALPSIRNARLVTADGTEVRCQINPLATWWKRDGPVRWALINATVRKGEQYFVEYGSAVRHQVATGGISIDEDAAAFVVTTGPMQTTISKQRATLLDSCALDLNGDRQFTDDELIITPELAAANLPMIVDGEGNGYLAAGADEDLKVTIARRGPMQTVVRREGWYVGDDGTRFCQFITYTYFFAGQAGMQHDHTLVVAFDSKEHQIRDVQIAVPVKVAPGWYGAFALEEPDEHLWREAGMAAGPMRLIQDQQDHWSLTQGGSEKASGEHASGCFGLYDLRWGAHAAVRDFWQQYPSELEVADGALRLHLWPAHDTPVLNFQPSSWMGDEYPGDRVFWQDFYRGGLDSWTQAYGVAKTHNIYVNFWAFDDRDRAASLTSAFDQPVLVYADPEWSCATEAFGRVHPEDRQQFPELEALVDAIVHRKQWLRERLGNYGWISFGDVNYNLESATDPENITYGHWRHWAQMFYGGPNFMPLLYLRSGRRECWDFHRSNTRHITDFDICHLDSEEFSKIKGGRYGGNGGICHYGADIYTLGCDCHLRFMLYDYYLNGNLRTWEVANEFMQRYEKDRDKPYYSTYQHRMTGGGLRFFSEAYEATWNPDYLSCAHQFADILYQARAELGSTRYDDVYMNEGKVKYYQLTGDERMRDLFLNDMTVASQRRDCDVFADCRHTILQGLSQAYWMTGDDRFLPYLAWQLDIARTRVPTAGAPHEIGAVGWTFEHAYESTLGNQLPVLMAMLAEREALPQPAGPAPIGSWAIYLGETDDAQFTLKLDCKLYSGNPGLGASPFQNWAEWFARVPEQDRPDLVITAPDGTEAARLDLTAQTPGTLELTVPADGQTGTYVVAPTNLLVPIQLRLVECSLPRRVFHGGDSWTHGATQFFTVPAGTGKFSVALKAIALRTQPQITIRNAAGEEMATARWEVGSECRHDWEAFELDAGQPAQDEAWSINFIEPMATFLHLQGVPGYVAASPAELFIPDRRLEPPAIEQVPEGEGVAYVDSGVPWGGQAAALPSGVGVKLSSPEPGRNLLDPVQGTIEMWVRDTRQHTDLHNRALLRCGALNLYRRINLGTYLYMGPGHQTGLVLPPGRWCHLAATWKPSAKQGTEVAIYADGVYVKTYFNRHLSIPEGDWSGPDLIIPADHAGLFVDELRASDVARYEGNFDLPAAPFEPDEHTLVLCHFDGDGQALALGQAVELAQP